MTNALTTVGPLQQALALAIEAGDITKLKDVAAWGAALQKGAKARGLGIESENEAAEVVIRAERAIGQALIAMKDEHVVRTPGRNPGDTLKVGSRELQAVDVPSISDMGLSKDESSKFQLLARIESEEFEQRFGAIKEAGSRLAKVNFYRMAQGGEKIRKAALADIRSALQSEEPTSAFRAFEKALKAFDPATAPEDELAPAAVLVMAWVAAYNARRARRLS